MWNSALNESTPKKHGYLLRVPFQGDVEKCTLDDVSYRSAWHGSYITTVCRDQRREFEKSLGITVDEVLLVTSQWAKYAIADNRISALSSNAFLLFVHYPSLHFSQDHIHFIFWCRFTSSELAIAIFHAIVCLQTFLIHKNQVEVYIRSVKRSVNTFLRLESACSHTGDLSLSHYIAGI